MSSEDFTSQEWKKRFVKLHELFLNDLSIIWPIIVNSMRAKPTKTKSR